MTWDLMLASCVSHDLPILLWIVFFFFPSTWERQQIQSCEGLVFYHHTTMLQEKTITSNLEQTRTRQCSSHRDGLFFLFFMALIGRGLGKAPTSLWTHNGWSTSTARGGKSSKLSFSSWEQAQENLSGRWSLIKIGSTLLGDSECRCGVLPVW